MCTAEIKGILKEAIRLKEKEGAKIEAEVEYRIGYDIFCRITITSDDWKHGGAMTTVPINWPNGLKCNLHLGVEICFGECEEWPDCDDYSDIRLTFDARLEKDRKSVDAIVDFPRVDRLPRASWKIELDSTGKFHHFLGVGFTPVFLQLS